MFFEDFEPLGILPRIYRIYRILPKWGGRLQLRTPLPHAPGARMTVVYKLPQIRPLCSLSGVNFDMRPFFYCPERRLYECPLTPPQVVTSRRPCLLIFQGVA